LIIREAFLKSFFNQTACGSGTDNPMSANFDSIIFNPFHEVEFPVVVRYNSDGFFLSHYVEIKLQK
jgi:hypothetical protein